MLQIQLYCLFICPLAGWVRGQTLLAMVWNVAGVFGSHLTLTQLSGEHSSGTGTVQGRVRPSGLQALAHSRVALSPIWAGVGLEWGTLMLLPFTACGPWDGSSEALLVS